MDASLAIKRLRALRSEADTEVVRRSSPEHRAWNSNVKFVMSAALGPDAGVLKEFEGIHYYIGIWTGAPGEDERDAQYFSSRVDAAAALIDAAIYQVELTVEDTVEKTEDEVPPRVFLVHGHDGEAKHHAARVVQHLTGDEPVILHEQRSAGETIIEKLDRFARPAGAAVVLLTPDDFGGATGGEVQRARARQNVVFEFGYFIGKLGRDRVFALVKGDVEVPSDLHGVIYIDMDSSDWSRLLGQELAGVSGLSVDMSRLVS
ncbi:MAG: nucleotide-binding protein [Microbacteriaceae bacterium]|nr:nucleotide-binding protein [Microbacteriaceae bacterium]